MIATRGFLCKIVVAATATVAVIAGLTGKVKFADLEAPLRSVTVIVSTVDAIDVVAVPVIAPVAEFNTKPSGKAGEIVNTFDPYPPREVTGIKDVAPLPTINFLVATATVVVNAAGVVIDKLKVAVANAAFASVTLTVCTRLFKFAVGVPVI